MKKNYSRIPTFKYHPQKNFKKYPSEKNFKQANEPLGAVFYIALATLLISGFLLWYHNIYAKKTISTTSPIVEVSVPLPAPETSSENISSYTISDGDIPFEILQQHGNLSANDTQNILIAADNIFDIANLKIDRRLDFFFDQDQEKCKKIVYYPNSEEMVVIERMENDFTVTKKDIPYEIHEQTETVEIDEFLYKDAMDKGLDPATIIEVADIFSFDIDFTTEIRQGDVLKIVYEKRTLNGNPGPDGRVLAAKFTNDGQDYFAYYFEHDNEHGHYDSEGKELVRQFLKAPLSYVHITSGYTGARMHPITKKISAHYQIDYAAPTGTPVVATARGTITSAGWETGWGNIIRLRHDNGYTTHYGHLSAYAKNIKNGSSVSQGQVIGYVGSTGWSTGPHLDYGMKLNGSPINPLSLKLPKGESLSVELLEQFNQKKTLYQDYLQ